MILGGHSLGGSVAGIYAAWEFGGRAGARDLAGIVEIDGGAGGLREGAPDSAADARAARWRESTADRSPTCSGSGCRGSPAPSAS